MRTGFKIAMAASLAGVLAVGGTVVDPLVPASPASAATITYGVGTTSVAPTSGGRYIYVATNGTDKYEQYLRQPCLVNPAGQSPYQDACPEPDIDHPLRTIQTAIRTARPGDVIVVRGGTYPEAIGWGEAKGTASKPIILQAFPDERVVVAGTLIMTSPDYWSVRGIRFLHNASMKGQAVVLFSGGRGWSFLNNEVTGTTGVANVLVNSSAMSGTLQQLQAGAANDYTIGGNCIHDNRGDDAQGTDHNIYLMSSIYSSGGVIERNLLAGAPRGANIKASASSPGLPNASPRNVTIRYNTMLASASGLTIGLKAQGVIAQHNLIAVPIGSGQYDGAMKTYSLAVPGKNAVTDSLLSGYARPISEDYGATAHIFSARNDTTSSFAYTGSVANCTARAASSTILAKYGQYAQ